MELSFLALLAALNAAICQTATDLGTKAATRTADDRAILVAQWGLSALLLILVTIGFYPDLFLATATVWPTLVKPGFWPLLFWDSVINIIAYLLYIRAFRLSDASLVAPLVLLTPVLMLVTSPIMLGEQTPPLGVVGVLFTVLGIGLLDAGETNPASGRRRLNFMVFIHDPGARAMIVTAALWSIGANIDKLGVQASTPLIWIASVTSCIAFFAVIYWLAGPRQPVTVHALRYAFFAGASMSVGNTAQVWALTILLAPYVIAIKRLSALFTVLMSGRFLQEETGGRLLGAAVMLLGAVLIALARG
jgi:drug/metabolite transporter (DMT)-like permease